MPKIIILAGPNGAGKTTFANAYLLAAKPGLVFVNADEIARTISRPVSPGSQDVAAARTLLATLDALALRGADFMFETTLATRTYARRIINWRSGGYKIVLLYLQLPDAETSHERVRRRVAAGGHDISEEVLRRRFAKSHRYLEALYKPLVDEWYVWDSIEGRFEPRQSWGT